MRKEEQIIDFNIYKMNFSSLDIGRNIAIIYVLKGNANINIDGKMYKAKEEDVVVININEKFSVNSVDESIIVCFKINHLKFNRLINKDCTFMCNSIIENNENYSILINKVKTLLNKSIDTGDYKNIYINKLYYDMLIFLINNFCNKVISSDDEDSRINNILNYIEDNYNYPLKLKDVSAEFFLTPEYFAKYFKENMGKTFLKYLNEVRIRYAVDDLTNTDNTVLKISLDNGFPNVASFNKSFKEINDISPSLYRKKNKKQNKVIDNVDMVSILEKINYYEEDENKNIININVDANNEMHLSEYWKEMIGIGSIELLSDSNVQTQIIDIKEQLGFKYLRVIFDNNKYINENNVYNIEKTFDFLVAKGFKLFIAFEYRIIEDKNMFLQYVKDVITKCANRYSINMIRSWKFELFYDCDFEGDKADKYFEVFIELSKLLKSFEIETELMGPGLLLNLGGKNLDNYLKKYKKYNINSSIITFSSMPCSMGKTEKHVYINRLTDWYYIKSQIDLANKIIKENKIHFNKLIISKWIDSLSSNNIINDSCYEGANIVNNILSCYGSIDAICYYESLDILSDKNNSNKVISGLPGLITKDGIKKPSYYSYQFLNHLLSKYVYKDKHCIIGVNDMKNYQIVAHNCKKLNYKYFTEDEHRLKIDDLNEYYDDKKKLTLSFKLNNLRNGEYLIKYRKINEYTGSVQDKIKKITSNDIEIGPSEINYLKNISIPSIELEKKIVDNEILEFSYILEPNEIVYIHIIYKY